MTEDRAVSTVVGTIIMIGLLVAALATYQLNVVPGQTEEAEARQMQTVGRGMSELTTDLLSVSRSASHAPLSSTVSLSREGTVLGAEERSTGSLSFEPASHVARLTTPNLQIVTRAGEPALATGDAAWHPIDDGDRIDDVATLLGFHVRIDDPSPADGDRVGIVGGDVEGLYAGELGVKANVTDTDLALIVETQEPPSPGTTVFEDHVLSLPLDHWDGDHHVDVTSDLYGFASLVGGASKPASLTFQDEGLDASYRVVYERQVASDVTTIVGDGSVVEDANRTYTTGALLYEAQNSYYPQQSLRIEHGALVRSQVDGAAFAIDPPLEADAGGGMVSLGLSVPSLRGPSNTVSGAPIATVRTVAEDHQRFGATAGEVNLTFGTDHPGLWGDFLERELTEAGLTSTGCPPASSDSACQFEITTSSGSARLEVHGPHATDADPQDPERDIFLHVDQGTIETEIQR